MTITEIAACIREDLKNQLGLTSKFVSVTSRRLGFDGVVTVKIRVPDINEDEVAEIARKYEKFRTDCTGEPLQGCNRYVDVYGFVA
jgi:hypothetical protein